PRSWRFSADESTTPTTYEFVFVTGTGLRGQLLFSPGKSRFFVATLLGMTTWDAWLSALGLGARFSKHICRALLDRPDEGVRAYVVQCLMQAQHQRGTTHVLCAALLANTSRISCCGRCFYCASSR